MACCIHTDIVKLLYGYTHRQCCTLVSIPFTSQHLYQTRPDLYTPAFSNRINNSSIPYPYKNPGILGIFYLSWQPAKCIPIISLSLPDFSELLIHIGLQALHGHFNAAHGIQRQIPGSTQVISQHGIHLSCWGRYTISLASRKWRTWKQKMRQLPESLIRTGTNVDALR